MKLLYSEASPYARKARACAIALGIDAQIELIAVDMADPPEMLLSANPLARVPTLITEDGFTIFDSSVICEYLNGSSSVLPIVPASGAARWLCLRLEALGDGLMDASVSLRHLQASQSMAEDNPLAGKYRATIARTLDYLERTRLAQHVDVGTIAIACALGYLDLRFSALDWRRDHAQLAAWQADFARHGCMARTEPKMG